MRAWTRIVMLTAGVAAAAVPVAPKSAPILQNTASNDADSPPNTNVRRKRHGRIAA